MKIESIIIKLLLTILCSSLLMACSAQKKTQANFKVVLGGITGLESFTTGGGMLYGVSDKGKRFAMRLDSLTGDSLTLNLENGTWNFNALAWDGDHDQVVNSTIPLTGKVFCGDIKGVRLIGSDVSLNISLSQVKCEKAEYSSSFNYSPTLKFQELKFKSCRNIIGGISLQSDTSCDNAVGAGTYSSIQVLMVPYENNIPQIENAIRGPCYGVTATTTSTLSAPVINAVAARYNIPTGTADSPFFTVIRGYYGSATCTDSEARGFFDRSYPNGLGTPNRSKSFVWDNSGTKTQQFFIDTFDPGICSGARATSNSNYAFGTVNSFWKGICNIDQLGLIKNASYISTGKSSNYILMKNINFYTGWSPGQSEPNIPNFPMVGEDLASASLDGAAFVGTFDGNGNSIVGLEIDYSTDSTTYSGFGFIRHLGAGGKVMNLNLLLPEIQSHNRNHSNIGSVVGKCVNGIISNVHVALGNVKGFQDIGGIVGNASNCTISKSTFEKGKVSGLLNVGGIAGSISSSILFQDKFSGTTMNETGSDYYCTNPNYFNESSCLGNGTWQVATKYGGVAGNCSGGSIDQVMTEGNINGVAYVGGLCGNHSSTTVTNSYSLANVRATGLDSTSSYVGGLFGAADWGSEQYTFHALGVVSGLSNDAGGLFGFNGAPRSPDADNLSLKSNIPAGITYANLRDSAYSGYTNFDKTNVWIFDDNGYDLPRLKWEKPRACNGKFATTFAGGDGSISAPYQICSAAQLAQVKSNFDTAKNFILLSNIDISTLANDQEAILIKTGNPTAEFNGTFNGNGFNINNLLLNNEVGDPVNGPLGLFSTISSLGKITNLNVWISTLNNDNPGAAYPTGTIAGLNKGIIEIVSTFGKFRNKGTNGSGGIVGRNDGMISGAESYVLMEGNSVFGGIAGYNYGGIIYSESNSSLYAVGPLASYVGGIVGKNINAGSVSFYDRFKKINRTFNGSIIESQFRGETNTMAYLIGTSLTRPFDYLGQIAGYNSGTILDSKADGFLNLGSGIVYKGEWDATTIDPTSGPDQIYIVNTAGTTSLGGISSWAIGDMLIRTSSGYAKIPSVSMPANLVTNTDFIYPLARAGLIVGKNDASGTITRTVANDHSQYSAPMASAKFSTTAGYDWGVNVGTISSNIILTQLNRPGTNITSLIAGITDVFIQSTNFAQALFLENASSASAGVIVTADHTGLAFSGDKITVGHNIETISAVSSNSITVANGSLTLGAPTPLILHIASGVIDLPYLTGLSFDVGSDRDLYKWVYQTSNRLPELSGPENFRHIDTQVQYYNIIKNY